MSIIHSPAMATTKEMPLRRKHHPMPTVAMSSPASAGPRIRVPMAMVELRLTALDTCSPGTSSLTRVRRPGPSKVLATPRTVARTYTAAGVTRPVTDSVPIASALTIITAELSVISRRVSLRSTTAPAHATSRSVGRNWQIVRMPTAVPLPVSR